MSAKPKGAEIPSVSKTVMVPDPVNGRTDMKDKRVSIVSSTCSILSDVSLDNGDSAHRNRSLKKTKLQRRRKRLSTLLHTHVVLILVCSLSALDAMCVIGQIICDVLIMKESIEEWNDLDSNLTVLLWNELPAVLNTSDHTSAETLDLYKISGILWARQQDDDSSQVAHLPAARSLFAQLLSSGLLDVTGNEDDDDPSRPQASTTSSTTRDKVPGSTMSSTTLADSSPFSWTEGKLKKLLRLSPPHPAPYSEAPGSAPAPAPAPASAPAAAPAPASALLHRRRKRAAAGGGPDGEGSVLYDLTHYFHLGSMIILSALLLECFLKVFAMGKKLLHHKLEMFDIFVVSVSWSLDVAFWEGIWAHPETEAATILIVMLPWRVIRIVNSFVLVIQEKDHVELKIVKQRLRLAARKGKEVLKKASGYKAEAKHLQSLCRKYGATEAELISCIPEDRRKRGSRGSLKPAISHSDSSLSLTGSTLQAFAVLDTMQPDSSDEDDLPSPRGHTRRHEPSLRSGTSVSTADEVFVKEASVDQVAPRHFCIAGLNDSDIGGEEREKPGPSQPGKGMKNGTVSRQESFTHL